MGIRAEELICFLQRFDMVPQLLSYGFASSGNPAGSQDGRKRNALSHSRSLATVPKTMTVGAGLDELRPTINLS